MTRLDVLKKSLEKKEAEFARRISEHFADVKSANGQPLNDKRCGHATFKRWDKQNAIIARLQDSIEKTKEAMHREENKTRACESVNEALPKPILDLVAAGVLSQWRKFPNTFFVNGGGKARIVYLGKNKIAHKYLKNLTKEEFPIFRDTFNNLKRTLENITQ